MSKKINNLPWPQMKRVGYAKFILEKRFDITITLNDEKIRFSIPARNKPYNGRSFIIRDGKRRVPALLHDVICENHGRLSLDICSKTAWTPLEAANLYYEVCTLYGVTRCLRKADFYAIRVHDKLVKNWD